MTRLLEIPQIVKERDQYTFFDDFDHLIEPTGSAGTASDIGSPKWAEAGDAGGESNLNLTTGTGGTLILNTDADDNDEFYFYSVGEWFKFAQDKPIQFGIRLKYTEASTDDANVVVGLMDGVAADALVDDGAGPKASYSGMVFFKEDGQTKWTLEASVGATQKTTQTDVTAGGGSYEILVIEFRPVTSALAEVVGWHNGAQVRDTTANANPIAHQLTYTSATDMAVVIGLKNGGGNAELVEVDYVYASQIR